METHSTNTRSLGTPTQKLKFEILLDDNNSSNDFENHLLIARAKVLGGWLVYQSWDKSFKEGMPGHPATSGGLGIGSGVTFIPDPEHKWNPDDYL